MSDPATSTIFGGNTGISYEDLVRRQAIAQALASQTFAAPKTFGEGLYSLGSSLASALEKRTERQLAQAQAERNAEYLRRIPPPPAQGAVPPPAPNVEPGPVDTAPVPTTDAAPAPTPDTAPPTTSSGGSPSAAITDAIMQATPDPDWRRYLTGVAMGEGGPSGSGNPFGIKGPTAKQYGVTDVSDPVQSARATIALTGDNINMFKRVMGRDPNQLEDALMHQQGATGGTNLLTGKGTSAANLTANYVAPSLPMNQQVAKIEGHYPVSDTVLPALGRDGIVQAITGKPPVPVVASAAAGTPATPTDIQPAPPAATPVVPIFPRVGPQPARRPDLKVTQAEDDYNAAAINPMFSASEQAAARQNAAILANQRAAYNTSKNRDDDAVLARWQQLKDLERASDMGVGQKRAEAVKTGLDIQASQREAATPKTQEVGGVPVIISPAQGAGAGGGGGGGGGAPAPTSGTAGGYGTFQVPPAITKLDPLEQQKVTGLISMLQAELQMSGDHKGKTLTDPGPWGRNVIGLKGPEFAQPSLMTPEFSQDYSGAVRWANALRGITAPKSGGAIGDDSLEKTLTDFFPRPNDTESIDAKFARRAVTARSNFDGLSEQAKQKYLYDAEHNRFAVNPDDPTRPLADGATAVIDDVPVISKNGLWVPRPKGGQ
jgi:hypothetical protein